MLELYAWGGPVWNCKIIRCISRIAHPLSLSLSCHVKWANENEIWMEILIWLAISSNPKLFLWQQMCKLRYLVIIVFSNMPVFVMVVCNSGYISSQVDKNPVQVDNIHSILTFAAFRFSAQQVDHLFQLIQQVSHHQWYMWVCGSQ